MFFLRLRFWITLAKLFALAFVAVMGLLQVPELAYDLGSKTPAEVLGPDDLDPERFPRPTFAAVEGRADFERAFVYRRYGLDHTYFQVEPYGRRLVVRTYEKVGTDWNDLRRFMGRLQRFDQQPFSYRIREIYRDRLGVEVPEGALYLALGDVPRVSGWQVGAVGLSATLWLGMLYGFFFHGRRRKPRPTPR